MIDIHLFIGDKEVDFNGNEKILWNYTAKELSNPTIVRNGWTKSLVIDSTPANDDIFNHFWNLERYQMGALSFNPMIKTPFKLFYNGELVEDGYCRLDSVKMKDNKAQYSITLFGSLGQFFYSLAYEGDDNQKKTLASLRFHEEYTTTEPDLDFTINKDTIAEAWHWLEQVDAPLEKDKFNVISFAPVYNGIPQDFDANKVIINNKDLPNGVIKIGSRVDEVDYRTVLNGQVTTLRGYSLGELNEEMTCDETFDLRSYLQRPVLNVRRTIQACCNPENNGGFQVKLDSHFFNTENPYWGYKNRSPWMTLPMLRDLEIQQGETFEISGATIENTTLNRKNIVFSEALSQLENVRLRLNVGLQFDSTPAASTLYTYRNERITGGVTLQGHKYVKNYEYNGGAVFQLVGRDASGQICAYSKAYCLSSDRVNPRDGGVIWQNFHITGYEDPLSIEFIEGKWIKSGSTYYFADNNGRQLDIEFTFDGNTPIATLELITQTNAAEHCSYKFSGWDANSLPNISYIRMWDAENASQTGLHTKGEVMAQSFTGTFIYNITAFEGIATDYESMFSGTYVPKDKLLSFTDPASFLLSYCKMFDLRFIHDPSEEADDPISCPNGVIHIVDRHTFYTGEVVDIHNDVDRSKEMTVSPVNAATKWYRFNLEEVESEVGEVYKSTYGQNRPYGSQTISTNYNYDNNTTELYDGNVFKSGIMVREKDKYFYQPVNNIPVYGYNGMKYYLYAEGGEGLDTTELELNGKLAAKTSINNLDLPGYDLIPKLQLHTNNNEASDGAGVLLFFKGMATSTAPYWITDDIDEMITLNDSNPCWIMTAGEYDAAGTKIAIEQHSIPFYTRDLIIHGTQEGRIVHSWNFGHPQETFVPNVYTTEGDSLYDKCWRDYLTDIFDQNSRKVTCYVRMKGHPGVDALRKFYWFDNSIWALNSITDWGFEERNTIKCEFIKIMDVEDYDMAQIKDAGDESVYMLVDSIPCTGGTYEGVVYLQSGGGWRTGDWATISGEDEDGNHYYEDNAIDPTYGSGEYSSIYVTFPVNSAATPITWDIAVEDDYDNWLHGSVVQEVCVPPSPSGLDEYLTLEITRGGDIQFLKRKGPAYSGSTPTMYIECKVNEGQWTSFIIGDTGGTTPAIITVSPGDKVYLRGNNDAYAKVESNVFQYYTNITGSAMFNLRGNIMSLIDSDPEVFSGNTSLAGLNHMNTFRQLFEGSGVVDASNLLLPATQLTGYCYYNMFAGCSILTAAPELPATNLSRYCYYGMFARCQSLTEAPALPATELFDACYASMFSGCISLRTAPELPATHLDKQNILGTVTRTAHDCYNAMFSGCISLTTAPALPATILSDACYHVMFAGCTGLTSAPILPASGLTDNAYSGMFSGCSSLNYIKCLATNISAYWCTREWVANVSGSGTFVKDASMNSWAIDSTSGVPIGWTVINDGEDSAWSATNISTASISGTLYTGASQVYASVDLSANEVEKHTETVPMTINQLILDMTPVPSEPRDYDIAVYNSRNGQHITCEYDQSGHWSGVGGIAIANGDTLTFSAATAPTPPTPTTAYVTYNAAGQLENATANIEITIVSDGGYSDSSTFQLSGSQESEDGDIDIQLSTGATTTLGIVVTLAGWTAQTSGTIMMRVAYDQTDTDYVTVVQGDSIPISVPYVYNQYLYVDIVWYDYNNMRSLQSAAEEEPENEPETPEAEAEK